MLGGSSQAQILQMDPEKRHIVMREIMRKSAASSQSAGSNINEQTQSGGEGARSGSGALQEYFGALPVQKQLSALQDGYKSMSTEFNKLSKSVPDPLITIKRPISMQAQLAGQLPLIAVEQKGGDSNENKSSDTTASSDTSSDNNSSTSTSTSTSSSGSTKTISFS